MKLPKWLVNIGPHFAVNGFHLGYWVIRFTGIESRVCYYETSSFYSTFCLLFLTLYFDALLDICVLLLHSIHSYNIL